MAVNYRCFIQKSYIDLKVLYLPVIRIAYILNMLHTESLLEWEFSRSSFMHRFPDTELAFLCQVAKFKANILFTERTRLVDQTQAIIAPFPSIPETYAALLQQSYSL